MGKELNKLRDVVWERCKGYCELCGKPLFIYDWALHHRKLRSQGGKDEVCNLIALHHKCHNTGTKSVHLNPATAKLNGWIVPSWGEPSDTAILYKGRDRVLLLNDGSIIKQ